MATVIETINGTLNVATQVGTPIVQASATTLTLQSLSNADILISPNGTGAVSVGGTAPTIKTAAATDLTIAPGTTGQVAIGGTAPTIKTAAGTDLSIAPGTTGQVAIGGTTPTIKTAAATDLTIAPGTTGQVAIGGTTPTIKTAAGTDLSIAPGTTGQVSIGGTAPTIKTIAATNLTIAPGTTGQVVIGGTAPTIATSGANLKLAPSTNVIDCNGSTLTNVTIPGFGNFLTGTTTTSVGTPTVAFPQTLTTALNKAYAIYIEVSAYDTTNHRSVMFMDTLNLYDNAGTATFALTSSPHNSTRAQTYSNPSLAAADVTYSVASNVLTITANGVATAMNWGFTLWYTTSS